MYNWKSQGSVAAGVFMIFFSVAFISIGIYMFSIGGASYRFGLTALMMTVFGVLFLVCGIGTLVRGKINQKVHEKGIRSTCIVEDFRVTGRRYGHSIWMNVLYKDQSGTERRYTARVGEDAITNLKKGMRIECYVLGDECYVDPNNIRVVDEDNF